MSSTVKCVTSTAGRAGDAGVEQAGLLEQREHRDHPAVAAAPDADTVAVHVGKRLQVLDAAVQILDVVPAPVALENSRKSRP